jgi:hypothetical protein
MPVAALPQTFNNSFWTQDYRQGLEVIYSKLQEVILQPTLPTRCSAAVPGMCRGHSNHQPYQCTCALLPPCRSLTPRKQARMLAERDLGNSLVTPRLTGPRGKAPSF